MKIVIEDNIPIPEEHKYAGRRGGINWVGVFKDMKDGQSFFVKGMKKGTLVSRFMEYLKTLPEEEGARYTYIALDRVEKEEEGSRIWINIAAKEVATVDIPGKDKSVRSLISDMQPHKDI